MRFLIELGPLALAALLAAAFGAGRFRFDGPAFIDPILRSPKLVAGVSTFVLCMGLSWIQPPDPYVHDEFAYLLAADTFASGRLTNPTPPAWQHFESFHTIVVPSYQAKYPPGQGIMLAIGLLLTGHAIVGVWLGMSLAAAAIAWMLERLFPPGWALLGGLLPIFRFGSIGNWNGPEWAIWSTSFWGGGVALFGGALLLGAAIRVAEDARMRDGLALGMGMAILANTRPYEGLVASAVIGIALLFQGLRRQPLLRVAAALGATSAVLIVTAAAMLTYNHAVTGDAFRMPYSEYYNQYEMTPQLSFLPPKESPPDYRHEVFRQFALEFQVSSYIEAQTTGAIKESDVLLLLSFLLGPALLVPLGLGALPFGQYWIKVALAVLALSITAHLFVATSHYFPHYLAPAIPALLLIVITGWRRLAAWSPRGRPLGSAISATLAVVCAVTFLLAAWWRTQNLQGRDPTFGMRRSEIIERLMEAPGKDLVVVQYGPDHYIHHEWVYNGADFESSPVLWARSMGLEADRELQEAYPDRTIWLFQPDIDLLSEHPLQAGKE